MSNLPPPPGDTPPDPFDSQAQQPAQPAPSLAPPSANPGVPPAPPTAPPGYGQPMVPQGYQPYPAGGAAFVPAPKSGKLLAGGIVAVVLSSIVLLVGAAIALIGDAFNDFGGGIGASIILLGLIFIAFGAFGLTGGIGAIMRRQWGRICSIVFGSINGVLALLALIGDGDGGNVVYLGMSIAIVVLCAMGPASPA